MRAMLMSLSVFGLMLWGASQASAQTYQEKKAALSKQVGLTLPYFASELEVAGAVDRVYDLVFSRGVTEYFGAKSLVNKIIVVDEKNHTVGDFSAAFGKVRNGTILYPLRLDISERVAGNLSYEEDLVAEVANLEKAIQQRLPQVTFVHESSVYRGYTSTNESYLQTLRIFDENVTAETLKDFAQVVVEDYSSSSLDTAVKVGLNVKKQRVMVLTVGRNNVVENYGFSAEQLDVLFDIAINKGLGVSGNRFMSDDQFDSALYELQAFLTAEKAAHLRSQGVNAVRLDPDFRYHSRLFEEGVLTLGTTQEEMTEIVDVLF